MQDSRICAFFSHSEAVRSKHLTRLNACVHRLGAASAAALEGSTVAANGSQRVSCAFAAACASPTAAQNLRSSDECSRSDVSVGPDCAGSSTDGGQCQECDRVGGAGEQRLGASEDCRLRSSRSSVQPHDGGKVVTAGAFYHPLRQCRGWPEAFLYRLDKGCCGGERRNPVKGREITNAAPPASHSAQASGTRGRWDVVAFTAGERFPHHLLMAQPPFEAWMRRSRGRVQLVISFRLLVLTDEGSLVLPSNCVYAQNDLEASKALGVRVLWKMAEEGMQLSSKFLLLLGMHEVSLQVPALEKHVAAQKEERVSAKRALQQDFPRLSCACTSCPDANTIRCFTTIYMRMRTEIRASVMHAVRHLRRRSARRDKC
eukprot:2206287-Pleurochrysis_carterae.AAC.2